MLGPRTVLPLALAATLLFTVAARAQDDRGASSRPPEIERLLEIGKDPDRLRQVLGDPAQVGEMMRLMESDAVREYVRDPQHVRELMSEVDIGQVREAIQNADPSVLRRAMLSRTMERLKKELGANDVEWRTLAPRLEKLIIAQQDARAGVRGGAGGGLGFGGGGLLRGNAAEPSEMQEAATALREAANDASVSPRETARRLERYRTARLRALAQVEKVEKDLRTLITPRQEGILVMLGLLN
jgi:hypothetical protein